MRNLQYYNSKIIIFLFVLSIQSGLASDVATEYMAKGTLTWKLYNDAGKSNVNKAWAFKAFSSNHIWTVETTAVKGGQVGRVESTHYDGTNLFYLDVLSNRYDHEDPIQKKRELIREKYAGTNLVRDWSTSTTFVSDSLAKYECRDYPLYAPNGIAPLWLSLCSAQYLKGKAQNAIQPVFDMGSIESKTYPIDTIVSYLDGSVRVPGKVVYVNKGWKYDIYLEEGQNKISFNRLQPPFDRSFTNAIYEVSGTTNIGGLILPLGFKLTHYANVKSPSGQLIPKVIWIYDGKIEELVRDQNAPSMVPIPTVTNTVVRDYRVRKYGQNLEPVQYVVKDGHWLGENEVFQRPGVIKKIERMRSFQRNAPIGWLLVVGAVILFPGLLLWMQSRKSRNNT
jgi:hypothetical protein